MHRDGLDTRGTGLHRMLNITTQPPDLAGLYAAMPRVYGFPEEPKEPEQPEQLELFQMEELSPKPQPKKDGSHTQQ